MGSKFIGDQGVETKVGDGITTNLDPSRNRESRCVIIGGAAETFEQTRHGTPLPKL
ncbi:MAG TPA: hypothetical protein VKG24_18330 [Pseudolabrys sp.]|nr:hypothetical protein [Pseudolabrys sp.]